MTIWFARSTASGRFRLSRRGTASARTGETRASPPATASIPAWSLNWTRVGSRRAWARRRTGGPWPSPGVGLSADIGNVTLSRRQPHRRYYNLARRGRHHRAHQRRPAVVDRAWLTWLPARDAMGAVSFAFESGPAFLRVRPSPWPIAWSVPTRRAETLRPCGRDSICWRPRPARPEVDLWPHLKGLTACVIADPDQPGTSRRRPRRLARGRRCDCLAARDRRLAAAELVIDRQEAHRHQTTRKTVAENQGRATG